MPTTHDTRNRLTTGPPLLRTGRRLGTRVADVVRGDLPSSGLALLGPLERDGDQRGRRLAVAAGIDVSVASRQVAALERACRVERRPDPRDGRAGLLRPSDHGAAALADARELRNDRVDPEAAARDSGRPAPFRAAT